MSWNYRVVKRSAINCMGDPIIWCQVEGVELYGNTGRFISTGKALATGENANDLKLELEAQIGACMLPILEERDGNLVEVESVQPVLPNPPDLWRCTECGGVFDEEECRVDEWPDHACPQCGVMLVPVRNETDIEKHANRRAALAADEEGR